MKDTNTAADSTQPLTSAGSAIHGVRRGKHKIFIGMAPGVGKTFRMLEEGHALKHEGIDVVIGLLETHGRKETVQRLRGWKLYPGYKFLAVS